MCLAVLVPEPFLRSHYRVRTSKPTYDFSKGKISPAGGGIFFAYPIRSYSVHGAGLS